MTRRSIACGMSTLRNSTLVFLVKKNDGSIREVCLAMKKRGFGMDRWNGVGGKVEGSDETISSAARRETKEEISVDVHGMRKVAELSFFFPHNSAWDQMVHVFLSEQWVGEPEESDEMRPEWFHVDGLPFDAMWPDDIFWLPKVIQGDLLKAMFVFGENDTVLDKKVDVIDGPADWQ